MYGLRKRIQTPKEGINVLRGEWRECVKVQYKSVGWITRKNVGFQPYIMLEKVEMMEMKKYFC